MKKIISIIALLCLLLALSACGEKQSTRPREYDGVQSADALIDYARRLEENGDLEAAAALYELIAKAAAVNAELPANGDAIEEYKEAQELVSSLGH